MPADDDELPAFAPQWLRAAPSQKASLAAGVGSQSHSKEPRTPSRSGFASDKEGSNTPFSNRRPSEKGGWTSPSAGVSALGKARSPGVGARQTFRTNSLDNVGSSREKLIYKEDDEARFNFSGRFPGAQQPNRTTSLDSPATGQRRDWDDPAPKNGPRLDWSAGGRRDAGGVRVRPNSARAGSAWGTHEKEYPALGSRPVAVREKWQSPVQEPGSGRADAEQWTSRLADVVPPTGPAVSPLLPATGTGAAALAASAPHTPRMADALQQGPRDNAAASAAEVLRREQAAVRQSKQLVPIIAQLPGAGKAKSLKVAGSGGGGGGGGPNGASPPPGKAMVHLNGGSHLPKKSSLEALGRSGSPPLQEGSAAGSGSSLVDLASIADRPASAAASLSHRAPPAVSTPTPTISTAAAPRSPAVLQGAARERNRNSFFDSLRRKSAPTSPSAAAASSARCHSYTASIEDSQPSAQPASPQRAGSSSQKDNPVADAGATPASASNHNDSLSSATEAGSKQHSVDEDGQEAALANGTMNGNGALNVQESAADVSSSLAAKLVIPAEEEAFLRSLGWEQSDDNNEGGLTEEEIAAFQAKAQSASFKRTRLQHMVKACANGADSAQALKC